MKRLLLLSIILLMASTAFAVTTPTFQVIVANARTLRAEGQAEAIGQVGLQAFTGGTSGIGGATDSFTISFNATISETPAANADLIACSFGGAALAACPAGFTATPSASGVTIVVPNATVFAAGDKIVLQNIRVDATGITGAVTAFVSANTLGVALTGVTNNVFVGNVKGPSITAAFSTTDLSAAVPVGPASPATFALTTCTLTGAKSTATAFLDVTETQPQAFTMTSDEENFTPKLGVTNGSQIQVVVSGIPAGYTVVGLNSPNIGSTATATYLGGITSGAAASTFKATAITPGGGKDVTLTWEITADSQTAVETVVLPIVVASNGTLTPVGTTANVTAKVRLAPVTGASPAVTAGSGTVAPGNAAVAGTGGLTVAATAGTGKAHLIPRFVDNTVANNIALGSISDCTTTLLYPFVVAGVAGFDTSIAIANTSKDTLGTPANNGTCTFTVFPSDLAGKSTAAPITAFTSPSVDAGGVYATSLGSLATLSAGVAGYGVATCNFLFAHGYAIITNGFNAPSAQPVSHGYQALVVTTAPNRGTAPEGLNQ